MLRMASSLYCAYPHFDWDIVAPLYALVNPCASCRITSIPETSMHLTRLLIRRSVKRQDRFLPAVPGLFARIKKAAAIRKRIRKLLFI